MDVQAPALADILPADAVAAEIEEPAGGAPAPTSGLFAAELAAIARAGERRRREFVGGRACARAALGLLGVEPLALPAGTDGAPLWPAGIVGSITHKGRYRAAAVARADALRGIGLDAELDEALPAGVLGRLARPAELETVEALLAERPGHAWDRLLFSAKEAAVKAVQPLGASGLETTEVQLDVDARSLSAFVPCKCSGHEGVLALEGRWGWRPGLVLVTAWTSPDGSAAAISDR